MPKPFSNSNIYLGKVMHRRFSPKKHSFSYRLYMLALDIDDVEKSNASIGIFGFSWFHPLRFVAKDYVVGEPEFLSERIKEKIYTLGGHSEIQRITMLVQVRCFGIYFSPANFYFCYDNTGNCTQMLAEVSNTPWNERHYYLVNLLKKNVVPTNKKMFQVSPFMDLDMTYSWRVNPPTKLNANLLINIQNRRLNEMNQDNEKIFDASLVMRKKAFTKANLFSIWCQLPIMTVKVVLSIYWQAMKLFIKRVPFIGYQKAG
jgi:hypothetical protein